LNLNAGQVIGADQAGQPLFPRYGRAVETSLIGPMGDNNYHSLQATLTKRYSGGLQTNVCGFLAMSITIPNRCRSSFRSDGDHDSGLKAITF